MTKMTEVRVHTRVRNFCKALPPHPRKNIRSAIRGLQNDKGDIKLLQGTLSGLYRLRAGAYRVIFSIHVEKGQRKIYCHYVEHRSIVYEVLEAKANLRKFLDEA
jgi:mRNA-degrading endonuclease RelE of RelBE toxin-antitoxin system